MADRGRVVIDATVERGTVRSYRSTASVRDGSKDWADAALPALAKRQRRTDRISMRVELDESNPEQLDVIALIDGEMLVRLRLAKSEPEEDPHVSQVEFRPVKGAFSTRRMRRLGLGELQERVGDVLAADHVIALLADGFWRRRVARPGSVGRPDLYYAEWAKRYVEALAEDPKRPVRWILDKAAADGKFLTEAQVRALVNRARERDLLTPSKPGKPGGELTAKARRLLGEEP